MSTFNINEFVFALMTFKYSPYLSIPFFYLPLLLLLCLIVFLLKDKKRAYEILFKCADYPEAIAKYPFYREFVMSDILFFNRLGGIMSLIPFVALIAQLIFDNIITVAILGLSCLIYTLYSRYKHYSMWCNFRIDRYTSNSHIKEVDFLDVLGVDSRYNYGVLDEFLGGDGFNYFKWKYIMAIHDEIGYEKILELNRLGKPLDYIYSDKNMEEAWLKQREDENI